MEVNYDNYQYVGWLKNYSYHACKNVKNDLFHNQSLQKQQMVIGISKHADLSRELENSIIRYTNNNFVKIIFYEWNCRWEKERKREKEPNMHLMLMQIKLHIIMARF